MGDRTVPQSQGDVPTPDPLPRDSKWLALTPVNAAAFPVPPWDHRWVMASNWPPTFTKPLWDYLSGLEWQTPETLGPGVSGVELLVDFVVSTSTLPPVKSARLEGYIQVLEVPLHAPTTIRAWVQALLEAGRQLSRFCRVSLLPQKRTKVFALKTLGYDACRSGLQQRPKWHDAGATLNLLRRVLSEDSILPLIHFVRHSTRTPAAVDPALLREYRSYTANERDKLARKLRGGRGRCVV